MLCECYDAGRTLASLPSPAMLSFVSGHLIEPFMLAKRALQALAFAIMLFSVAQAVGWDVYADIRRRGVNAPEQVPRL
jgi:hypothetical protein